MHMLQILPIAAYLVAVIAIVGVAVRAKRTGGDWRWPALFAILFGAFSIWTFASDGLLIFWTNHTANLAGNQVWFDLLSAVAISFFLIAPRARAVQMPLMPWAIAVVATASIALFPMLARLLWLESKRGAEG